MFKFLAQFDIRTKLLMVFALLLSILVAALLVGRQQLLEVNGEIGSVVHESGPVALQAGDMASHLDHALVALGMFVSTRDPAYAEQFRGSLHDVLAHLDSLSRNPALIQRGKWQPVLLEIKGDLHRLSALGNQLLLVAASDELTFPGLAYANERLNPVTREGLQVITQMLHPGYLEPFPGDRELLLKISDLRYYWVQVVSGLRAYLAYRSADVLEDTEMYYRSAQETLEGIAEYGGHLTLEQQEGVHRLRELFAQYESHWRSLLAIHGGEGWRADSELMRTRIAPLVDEVVSSLKGFADAQLTATKRLSEGLYEHSESLVQLMGASLAVISLAGIWLAWVIDRVVAKPIRAAAVAMRDIAGGEADLTRRMKVDGRDEVALLLGSFNTFVDKAQHSAEEERALSRLLHLSLSHFGLERYLDEALALIMDAVTWLSLLPTGGVFLSHELSPHRLRLVSTHNFEPQLLSKCATVEFGECLCGRAAASGRIEFSDCVDHRHDIHFEGMSAHGHYSVPIRSASTLLGVLVLYVPEGHRRTDAEERFLQRVAEVLSMGIRLRQTRDDLLAAKQRAEVVSDQLTGVTANIPGIIFQCDGGRGGQCSYPYVSPGTGALLGAERDDAQADIRRLFVDIHPQDRDRLEQQRQLSLARMTPINAEYRVTQADGSARWVLCHALPRKAGDRVLWDGLLLDITDRKTLEFQLLQAQKLESVGQLAAGIAHEINTPTQYVQDNTRFLHEAYADMQAVLDALQALRAGLREDACEPGLVEAADQAVESGDLDYLREEVPRAIEQSLEGLQRISTIVSAMKEFSHPGTDAKQPVNLNGVVENIVTVSRNEWKYDADLEMDLADDLPTPAGYRDKLGQVILNLIVNAAHAIGDEVAAGRLQRGLIRISTRRKGNGVEIEVADNGPGIPESIASRVFDPFFTTKEVGKGTGQGLAIARSVVVDQHQGELELRPAPDGGASFLIRLPVLAEDGVQSLAEVAQ